MGFGESSVIQTILEKLYSGLVFLFQHHQRLQRYTESVSLKLKSISRVFVYIFQGWELLSVISPIFVAFLLTFVSGIPLLEKLNEEKWKGNPQYRQYMKNTPKLIPYLY